MEAVWGAVLSFIFVLATLSGYNITGSLTSEQQEQLEKKMKEQKEEFEKKQKEKSDKSENKQKSDQTDKSSLPKASKKKSSFCIKDCPDEWRIRN